MPVHTKNYGLVKSLGSEHYDVAVTNGNMDIVDRVLGEIVSGNIPVGNAHCLQGHTLADILPKQMVLEIDTANWIGTTPPFTKEIPIAAITAEDTPIIGLVPPKITGDNIDMVRGLQNAYAAMSFWESFGGKLVITCLEEKPEVAVTVQLDFSGARNLSKISYETSNQKRSVIS